MKIPRPKKMPRKLQRETWLDYAEKCARNGIRYQVIHFKEKENAKRANRAIAV